MGELRPSQDYPGRSAILGLVGACLGLRREEGERLTVLSAGLSTAVRVDAAGRRRDDYHTVQAPRARRGFTPMTRREELAGPPRDLETMVTRRTYREDAVYTILLAPRLGADPAFSLDAIAGAMREPRFQPYLGRKSCPPALPLFPLLSQTAEGAAALAEADIRWSGDDLLASLLDPGPQSLHWDHDFPMGLAADRETWRRDEPGDRGRWQFTERLEYAGWWRPAKGGEA